MKAAILLASELLRDQRSVRELRTYLEQLDEATLPAEEVAWLRLAIAAYGERESADALGCAD